MNELANRPRDSIRIGGGSGYWGDADFAVPQLLAAGDVDYIAFDYLAEITMSILARARAKNSEAGYATDFVTSAIAPNLSDIVASGVKILSNAGGVNPAACAKKIQNLVREAGLDLVIATVTGDDLTHRASTLGAAKEMFAGEPFPSPDVIASINAYLGAFPIAQALDNGADIVITGRCVDSALTLAACIHEFGWKPTDWDALAAGSLAGHLLECGPQATGGNHTDWQSVAANLDTIGYPIAEVDSDGAITITKPTASGGSVTQGTVAEQLLYEIGDPRTYILPDVVCDFSDVTIEQSGKDRVVVRGAVGQPATTSYKACATYNDGFRIITLWYFIGQAAADRAGIFADAALARARRKLVAKGIPDFEEVQVDPFGSGSRFGPDAAEQAGREVALRLAARHEDPAALSILLKEASGMALATPPGMALYTGGRPSPSPVVRLFSFLVDKSEVEIRVTLGQTTLAHQPNVVDQSSDRPVENDPSVPPPSVAVSSGDASNGTAVALRELAWGRSGDKGDKANIGIIARQPQFLPIIWSQITEDLIASTFAEFLKGPVERFYLPGVSAMNFLLHDVLGGGGMASLRIDPQGKSFAEIILDTQVQVPRGLLHQKRQPA